MSRILVCDGEQRAALAVVRSLGRAGHQIDVCSHDPRAITAVSRYVNRFAIVPNPIDDPRRFVAAVGLLVKSWESEVVLPVTDQSSAALLPARDQLGGAVVPGPDGAAFSRVSDKQVVLEEAARLGIATPRQIVVPDSTAQFSRTAVPFPVVIKPSTSLQKGGRWQVRYAADVAALERAIAEAPADAFPLLVQQRIVGWGSGIFLLVWGGRTIAAFAHRRLREMPPSGGASVYCESVAADPALVKSSRALLDRFTWQGVAMIEYKIDAATGTPYLMEVNGRFWGSLQLAIDAGVNFPALLVAAATGQPASCPPAYRTGSRLRWLFGDIFHALLRLRYDRAALQLPPGEPGRWRVVWDAIAWHPRVRYEVWRWWDPRPFVRGTLNFFMEWFGREKMTRIAEPLAEEWADPTAEEVSKLISKTRAIGWGRAVEEFADQAPFFAARMRDLTLSNWHLLVPHRRTGRALDVGCGFGSLLLGLSQFFSTAVGIELLPPRLAIAVLRTREAKGAAHVLKGTGMILPFASGQFDLGTLNGVLEWAALHEAGPPRVLQLQLLQEMRRILSPGGHLAVAIENRFGLEGLLGFRDTHTGLPWVPVLPRRVADMLTRWRIHQPYRTYLYGLRGYVQLLRQAGFPAVRVLDLAPSYNNYQLVVDPRDRVSYRFLARHDLLPGFYPRATAARAILGRALPGSLGRVAYSYLVWGGSDATTVLDADHPIWRERALAADGVVRRFACRGTRVGSLVVIEHDGERVRRAIELGTEPGPADGPPALPESFANSLASAWTGGEAVTAVGLGVRVYTPSS